MIEEPASMDRMARFAGGLYLLVALFAAFGNMYVPSVLLVHDDPLATSRNIVASEWLYRSGIVRHLIGQTIFIVLVLTLYCLLKVVNGVHAALMTVLALLAIPLAVVNEVNHLAVLRLLNSGDTQAFSPTQLQAQVTLFLELWEAGILVTLMFWGLWLLPLGLLVFRSGFPPAAAIEAETQAMVPVVVSPTLDRSVLGILVDFAKSVPYHLVNVQIGEETLRVVEDRFAEIPCHASQSFERVVFPETKAPELLRAKRGAG